MDKPVVSGRMRHPCWLLSGLIAYCLSAGTAWAEPLTLNGSLSSRHSDNIGKDSQEESDTETTARIGVRHISDPGQCQSELSASLGYSYWLNDFYDPESRAESGFDGNCEIRPGLDWQLRNNLTEVLASSRENDTPENRSRRNIFSTGPVWVLPLSPVDQISANVNYENTEYEEPEIRDSERYTGSLGWNHLFNETLTGGLSATLSRQELDNGAETDATTVNVNMNKTWVATQLDASVGFSERENRFGSAEQTSDGLVGSVTLNREINPSASLYVSASRQLTDQASDFTLQFDDVSFDLTEEAGIEVSALEVGLDKAFSDGTAMNVQGYANWSDYLQTDEQENVAGARINVNRSIRPQLSIRGSFGYEYLRYELDKRDDQRVLVTVGLSYRLTKDLDVTTSIGHDRRDSELASSEYDENWAQVSLDYRFF